MSTNTISPRPTLEQVMAMLNFMEKHPNLALGKMKGGVEARAESKKLWLQLSRILNSMSGPTRPTKSWLKFWSDKKSNVKIKVQSAGGDVCTLSSNIERRIWDLFLSNDSKYTHAEKKEMNEPQYANNLLADGDEDVIIENNIENNIEFEEHPVEFEEQPVDFEDRHINIMDKLVRVMGEQATALSQLAHASSVNAQAMERLAEASLVQASAVDRLASSFETISASSHDMRDAIVDMDLTIKRLYSSPT